MPTWPADRVDPERYPGPGHELPVLFADLDVNGHLNNVAMGRFFEHARAMTFRQHDFWGSARADGGRSFVVRVAIDYLREVQLDEVLHVRTRFAGLGTSSARVEQAAWVGEACVGLADVTLVHARDGASAPWPPAAVALLESLVVQP